MDDDDLDDWMMDDWEEESFDEDVDDHSNFGTFAEVETASFDDDMEYDEEFDQVSSVAAAFADDEDDEETEFFAPFDGGGSTATAPAARTPAGGGRMGWSAWDVGTVFALGGWLADHHADRTAQQVAAALAERNIERPASGTRLGAAHPPPSSGYPYQAAAGTLTVDDPLDQGALFAELVTAEARGQDLMIQAEGPVDLDRTLVLIISAVPGSSGPRFWVVAEEQASGFGATRLIPVFERNAASAVAIFATDHAHEAVDAAAWACQREGLPIHEFHVAQRQPI
jgi:hypothetical protein